MRPGGVGGDASVRFGVHEPAEGAQHDRYGEVGGEQELFMDGLVGGQALEPGGAAEGGESGDVGVDWGVGEFAEERLDESAMTVGALEDEGGRGSVGDDDRGHLAVGAEAAEDVEHRAGVFELHVLAGERHLAAVVDEHGHLQARGSAEEGDGARVFGADVLMDRKPLDQDCAGGGEFFEHRRSIAVAFGSVRMKRGAEQIAVRASHAQRANKRVGDVEVAADLTATLRRAEDATGVGVIFVEGEKDEAIDARRSGPVAVVDFFEEGVEFVSGFESARNSEPAADEEPGEAAEEARREVAVEARSARGAVFFEGEAGEGGVDAAGGVADVAVDVDDHGGSINAEVGMRNAEVEAHAEARRRRDERKECGSVV